MAPIDTIDSDAHVLRARRTAAITRATLGVNGMLLILAAPSRLAHPVLGAIGFAVICTTATTQLLAPRMSWLKVEESLAGAAAILIIGLGNQRVSILSMLWLAAVASGVMARGGRVHWIGRTVVLSALALPVIRQGHALRRARRLCVASIGLLLTSGRLTRELNHLLGQARDDAENAETLLLAGDIASRVARRSRAGVSTGTATGTATPPRPRPPAVRTLPTIGAARSHELEQATRQQLARLIDGDGLAMVVQPIVDLRSGSVHAYEALARFGDGGESPLHWLAVAQELGERDALERACLKAALELFATRPPNGRLTVNLSAPVLLDLRTLAMFERLRDLRGLIIEITEETLVSSDGELHTAIAPLQARGACLAVDDMGAGYSGLRQITAVHPRYLKLDRSLISGIDRDARSRRARAGTGRLLAARRLPADRRGHRAARRAAHADRARRAARPGVLSGASGAALAAGRRSRPAASACSTDARARARPAADGLSRGRRGYRRPARGRFGPTSTRDRRVGLHGVDSGPYGWHMSDTPDRTVGAPLAGQLAGEQSFSAHRRVLALTSARLIFAVLTVVAVAAQYLHRGKPSGFYTVNYFSYFTNDSNLLATALLLLGVWRYARTARSQADRSAPAVAGGSALAAAGGSALAVADDRADTGASAYDLLRGAAVLYMAITGMVFTLLLSRSDQALPWANAVVHYIMPVVIFLDWLVDPPRARLTRAKAARWLIFPLVYFAYTLIRGAIVDWYPYPFFDVSAHGYGRVLANGVGVLVGMLLVGAVTLLVGNARRARLQQR